MPLDTMVSAVWRIRLSVTLQPKLFQSFQPSCGVRPRPFSRAWAEGASDSATGATVAMSTADNSVRSVFFTGIS